MYRELKAEMEATELAWAGETKPDDLSCIPRAPPGGHREVTPSSASDFHGSTAVCVRTHQHHIGPCTLYNHYDVENEF